MLCSPRMGKSTVNSSPTSSAERSHCYPCDSFAVLLTGIDTRFTHWIHLLAVHDSPVQTNPPYTVCFGCLKAEISVVHLVVIKRRIGAPLFGEKAIRRNFPSYTASVTVTSTCAKLTLARFVCTKAYASS